MTNNPLLQTGDDLAAQALGAGDDQELLESDKLAQTLESLQNIIEKSAKQVQKIYKELKEKRQELKNVFDNDTQLTTAQEQVQEISNQVKERRSKLQTDPQVTSLKAAVGELNQEKNELEEALSNHLVNYYGLTQSTSFDTSDGDQWEFTVKAKVKSRKS